MNYISQLGKNAKAAEAIACSLSTSQKNKALKAISDILLNNIEYISFENQKDIVNANKNGMAKSLIDRLTLTEQRVNDISEGILQVMGLKDPIGNIQGGETLPNGLRIIKKTVPLGVIGIIFESRPNVTVDAAVLCLKAGNAVILRGGSDAINSNKCLVGLMRKALEEQGLNPDLIQLVENTGRDIVNEMMKANKYIDVLIPRGGGGLINAVIENSTIPVIQTGEGNCSIYVDRFADLDMAVNITNNAKTQRPSVCNSIENIILHRNIAEEFLKKLKKLWGDRVSILGDTETADIISVDGIASDEDYGKEFLDYKIDVKIVGSIEEAIEHINEFGTKHSEIIVTEYLKNADKFQLMVDAAAVYVNASSRFTDGFEFGLGAEIGISTQKLHARGPMGLQALTTYKYLINGNGQVRS